MLITERTSDGRTIVRIHKDWHPGRLGCAYIKPQRVEPLSPTMERIQTALLYKPSKRPV